MSKQKEKCQYCGEYKEVSPILILNFNKKAKRKEFRRACHECQAIAIEG
jgi:MinD superfamily P-loop ATPase